jgi:hypothetical protein
MRRPQAYSEARIEMCVKVGGLHTRATSTSIRWDRSAAQVSQALRVGELDRDDIGDREASAAAVSFVEQLMYVC